MNQAKIFILLTDGQKRLEISGPLDLLNKFMASINRPEIFNRASKYQ